MGVVEAQQGKSEWGCYKGAPNPEPFPPTLPVQLGVVPVVLLVGPAGIGSVLRGGPAQVTEGQVRVTVR